METELANRLQSEREKVNTYPTELQKKAGNYKMGHIRVQGMDISIENPKGSYRRGKSKNGKEWSIKMNNDYGYFTRSVGKDGDAVDVFLGPNLSSDKVFPIDQYYNGEFDETKVMLGFDSKEEAKSAYLSNYEKNWKGFKYITEVDIDTFKGWLYNGRRQRKPFALYKTLNEDEIMINEDFSSPILAKLAKEHGGIRISNNGGVRTFPCAFIYGHSVNPSEITDDMIVGEPFEYSYYNNDTDNSVLFNDGTAIKLSKDSDIGRHSGDRKIARFGSGIGDTGDHDKTPDAFTGNEKKAVSAPYNGWQSSDRAGYSQSLRNAYKVNKEMGDTKTVDKIKAQARNLVAENTGKKIYLSESQFKNYCRYLLREKRKEDYVKKLMLETMNKK